MKLSSVLVSLLFVSSALLALAPASAKPLPEQACLDVYREYDFGAVRYVSRDSCSAEIYVDGQQVWPPQLTSDVAPPTCVLLFYVADYHWTYVCVEPKDASCVVYVKYVNGMTETRDCAGVPAMDFVESCVLLVYVADYQWTYLCVDPKDPGCAVYIKRVSGFTETRDCVGVSGGTTNAGCVPITGNLEETYLCANPKDVRCPAYTVGPTGKHCVVSVGAEPAAAGPVQECIPTSSGMDYMSFLCVDSTNPKCAVYTITATKEKVVRKCVTDLGMTSSECLQVYSDYDFGLVRVESKNSCHRQVYVDGQPILP